jgi:hypothetical protein
MYFNLILAIAILISFYTWSGQRLARRARTMTAIHGVALYNLAQPGSSFVGRDGGLWPVGGEVEGWRGIKKGN